MSALTRRKFLQLAALTAAALGLGAVPVAKAPEPEAEETLPVHNLLSATHNDLEMADSYTAWYRVNGGDWMRLEPRALNRLTERNFIEGDTMLVPIGVVGEVSA